ncbi:hypothetical protein PPERSA_09353 [Pseudocohnilembus persalinus]|uniref:Transmembrane protein n=1 Tax=Pseudocohnilembus persalinus TaxID=266149 RepID=A0A0V0QXN4_PSEPJ|nr:hypothetical protein PPERSA_09353 [Pseudocohnilembus persalinus]|eukprot:KRX07139.1 hypothetical protein PPERSA_09353 [Pseudocohnilembus persalinus]
MITKLFLNIQIRQPQLILFLYQIQTTNMIILINFIIIWVNQLLGGGIILFSGQYYFRHTYSRKAKGLDKLSSIYRPNESEEEMIIFKGSTMELIFDDPSLPAGILFPKRMMSLLKMVQMCNKYGLGVINKDLQIKKK